ncbi:MAG: IclR family transcriptional regulator [Pseudomonadota bacterium]
MADDKDAAGIQTIARAAAVLRALERESEGMSLAELGAALELPRASVQRLVNALKAEGFVMAASARGGVRLGPSLIKLSAAAGHHGADLIRPIVRELSQRLRETVDVSILQGGAAVFVDQVVGRQRLVAQSAVGERFPLHVTAPGKALLARLGRSEAEHALAESLRQFRAWPLTDKPAFWASIDTVREEGFATDEEEHSPDISAVGIAIADTMGLPLMVSIPSPTQRYRRNRDYHVRELIRAGRRMEATLADTPTRR